MEPFERLQQARRKAGYESAVDAAKAFGWTVPTYISHENGTRGLRPGVADRYAKAFKVRPDWLLYGTKSPQPIVGKPQKGDALLIPLISWVSAGKMVDTHSQLPVEDVPLLAFADLGRGDFFALRVVGDSMDRVSPDGSVVVINKAERTLISGKPYIFSQRGEATYKIWRPDPPRLAPYSTNPIHEPIFVKSKKDVEVIGRVKRTVLDL